jgi:hypothetical protein
MVLQSIRGELAEMWELLLPKMNIRQSAAEKVVGNMVKGLHDGLLGLEAKTIVLDTDTAKKIRDVVATAKGDKDDLVVRLDTLLKGAQDAEDRLAAQLEQQKQQAAAQAARINAVPTPVPAPAVSASEQPPAVVDNGDHGDTAKA